MIYLLPKAKNSLVFSLRAEINQWKSSVKYRQRKDRKEKTDLKHFKVNFSFHNIL